MGSSSFFNNPTDYEVVEQGGGDGSGFYGDGPAYTAIDPVEIENFTKQAKDAATASEASAASALASATASEASHVAALTEANLATTRANEASASATASANSATASQASRVASDNSAAAAAGSASTATTQAGTATTKAGEASTSAANAATSAANALSSLNSFKGVWYGSLASNPSLDPLGAPINAGDAYWNSTVGELRIYNGTAWTAYSPFSGAPAASEYLVRTADSGLSAERVVGDTASIAWDWTVPGAAKASVAASVRYGQNVIINSSFRVNQRNYASGVTLAAGAYGHDRWKAGAGGCTYTFSQLAGSTVITITSGTLIQIVEDKNVEGGSYVLSWTGTAQARVGINTTTPAIPYAPSPLSPSGQSPSTVMSVEFGVGTVSKVKLETGTAATPYLMPDAADEMMRCQPYARIVSGLGGVADNSGVTINLQATLTPPMRTSPTVLTVGGIIASDNYASNPSAASPTITAQTLDPRGGRVSLSGFTGLTGGRPYFMISGNLLLTAEM